MILDETGNPVAAVIAGPTSTGAGATAAAEILASKASTNSILHPLNDPLEWLRNPSFEAPLSALELADVQKRVDDIIGTTRGGESIAKIVWNGDTRFWRELFMSWDNTGKPTGGIIKRPIVRYKALRDSKKKLIRDIFPPRYIVLTRLEPEQYPNYRQESFQFAPEINAYKLIRPDTPPPVYWLWYATVGEHNGYCCVEAEKNCERCYGKYAHPMAAVHALAEQKSAAIKSGVKDTNPFGTPDLEFIRLCENQVNGYADEIRQLKVEQEVYLENPYALLGIVPSLKAELTHKDAERIVKEFYERELEETAAAAAATVAAK